MGRLFSVRGKTVPRVICFYTHFKFLSLKKFEIMNTPFSSKQEMRDTKLNYYFQVEDLKLHFAVVNGLEWQFHKLILNLPVMLK